ncbi:hypothetical protein K8R47_00335 [archaeon]|nr:hypothetical protein [archaeon]
MDAFLALFLFILVLIMIYSYYVNPLQLQQQYYSAQDIVDVFSNVKITELSNVGTYQGNFIGKGEILISEYICSRTLPPYDPEEVGGGLAGHLFRNIVPAQYDLRVTCDDLDYYVYDEFEEDADYRFVISKKMLVRDVNTNSFDRTLILDVGLKS